MGLIRISERDGWVVDYDKERGMYRVSVFKDYHFLDEFWFDAYKDKEIDDRIEKIIDKLKYIKIEIMKEPHCWDRNNIRYFCNKFIEWIKEL